MRQYFDLVSVHGAEQRRGEDVGGGALRCDPSSGEYRHTMGVRGRKPQIVQDHDNRPAVGRQCTRDTRNEFPAATTASDPRPR